jgi:hypothetical protein
MPDIIRIGAPCIEHLDQCVTGEKLASRCSITLTDGVKFCVERIVIAFREYGQVKERVRHAAHGRNHDTKTRVGHIQNNACYPAETLRISEAAATKLVNFPAIFRHFLDRPVRKTVHDNGTLELRLLFYLKPV